MTFQSRAFVFFDTETTGLDPTKHEILEIGWLKVDAKLESVSETGRILVRARHPETADPEALRVNGLAPTAPALSAVDLRDALRQFLPSLQGATPAGHNVQFDLRFLESAAREAGEEWPVMDYHVLDTAALAMALKVKGLVSSVSLGALCRHFDIPRPEPHRALSDALCSLAVARRLCGTTPAGAEASSWRGFMERLDDLFAAAAQARDHWPVEEGSRGEAICAVCHAGAADSGHKPDCWYNRLIRAYERLSGMGK